MATDTESFNRDLYDLLKVRGYNPVPLDARNQRVGASQDADVIEFTFKKDGDDYGKVWITVDDAQNIIVYYDNEQQDSSSIRTPGVEYDDTWTGLLKFLKNWAQRRQMGFELSNKDRLGDDMRQREYYKMKEKLGESYHPMGKKASYNDAVPSVKIILQHNRNLEEGEARFRNVARIFLENIDGERFLAPTTKPGLARVYARHIAEGGLPNDERWNHIKSICEDYGKMAGFVRATRNKQFNESAQQLINEGVNHYNNLRETLHKLAGHRGYQAYFESWTPTLMEGEGEDVSEMFMSQSLDPRIESAMPILARLKKPVNEMEEVDTLAEWADSIISEKLEMDAIAEDEAEYVVSAMPKKQPTKVKAKSRDEAIEKAAKMWNIPANKITLHGSEDGNNQSYSDPGTPDGGTALDRATAKAKKPNDPWYKPIANPDDLWSIGKLAIGLGEDDEDTKVVKLKPKKPPYMGPLAKDFDDEFGHYDELGRIGKLAAINRGSEDDMDWDDDSWIPDVEDFEDEEMAKELSRHRGRFASNDIEEAMSTWSGKGLLKKMRAANKSFKRGLQGWEKGMHDVDTVKRATATLDQSMKDKIANKKVTTSLLNRFDSSDTIPKGSPAELQQKLIKREKNKSVDEATGYYSEKHPKHDQMTKDGYEHSIQDIQGEKLHRYFKPGVSLVDLYKYDDEEVKEDLGPEQKRVGQLGPTEKVKNNNIGKLVGASESKEVDPELARIIEMAKFKR